MNKQIALLVCVLVTVQVNSTTIKKIQPRDIIDEAQKQLDELKRIVQGDIMVAHDELDNAKTDFFTFSDNTIKDGAVALQQEHETIVGQVTTLKELAHSAGKDISSCTEHREDAINRLPGIYSMEMFRCVRGKTDESDRIVKDSKYIVDIAINTVHHLQQQLDRCGNNILCVEPVVTEIQLDMVRLPANIKTEVNAAKSLLTTLQLSVQQCSDVKVSAYASNANTILQAIVNCANAIIG